MTARTYTSPAAFKQALEARLRAEATRLGRPIHRQHERVSDARCPGRYARVLRSQRFHTDRGAPMSDPRITVVPGLCGGRPTIRGLRITVADVLELLAGGMSHDDIVADYPYLEREDIVACLRFAASQARREEFPIRRDAA